MTVSCSLPPSVDGQLRCFLSVVVGDLLWTIPTPPKDVQTAIVWWGQKEKPILLRPVVETDPTYKATEKNLEAHYPVRCGPKQFNAYLRDMGSLHLDILYGPSLMKFARVEVPNLKSVTASNPLTGVFPIICTTSKYKKRDVGKLKVTLLFKTISDVYNVSSPALDRKEKSALLTSSLKEEKVVPVKKKTSKLRKKSLEDGKGHVKKRVHISQTSPDRIRYNATSPVLHADKDISFIVGPGANLSDRHNSKSNELLVAEFQNKQDSDNIDVLNHKDVSEEEEEMEILQPIISKQSSQDEIVKADEPKQNYSFRNHSSTGEPNAVPGIMKRRDQLIVLSPENQHGVLFSLLSKGQQLRGKMIKSTLDSQHERLADLARNKSDNNKGSLIKELLDGQNLSDEFLEEMKFNSPFQTINKEMEFKAVDLVLGQEEKIEGLLKKLNVSDESVYSSIVSDDQDPLHDSSLLSELFYNTKQKSNIDESSILFSDDESQVIDSKRRTHSDNGDKTGIVNSDLSDVTGNNQGMDSFESSLSELNHSSTHLNSTETANDSSMNTKLSTILPEQVTVQQLTELARVKSVRLSFNDMILREMNGIVYFIETTFPMSIEGLDVNAAHETLRLVSRKVKKDIIEFDRVSLFPIYFNEKMIQYWWDNKVAITLLTKFTKNDKPSVIAKGSMKLRRVITSEEFSYEFTVDLFYVEPAKHNNSIMGKLMANIELIRDHRKSVVNSKIPEKYLKKQHVSTGNSNNKNNGMKSETAKLLTPIKINMKAQTIPKQKMKSLTTGASTLVDKIEPSVATQVKAFNKALNKDRLVSSTTLENTLLQSVILIEEGKDIFYNVSSRNPCNLYFVCRVFWSKEELKSKICWNTNNPVFHYQQVIAVPMISDNVNKMKNNFMIIEVWHKSTTTQNDKLIGMGKVSLHQFYLSYRDSQIADAIMKSKYPVISHDGWVHVRNLISGKEQGSLKVLFALGMHDQIMELLLMHSTKKNSPSNVTTVTSAGKPIAASPSCKVTHQLEITIEGVKAILQKDEEVWGETDCFIQYDFPVFKEGQTSLGTFQSKMTLCIPSPVFHHTISHEFTLHRNTPLQQMLLKGFSNSSTPGEVLFELWKRHYYPNIRDQFVANASLPIAKLCAMITMHDQNEVSSQSFHLPFKMSSNVSNSSSTLDIFAKYQNTVYKNSQVVIHSAEKVVCLSVSVLKLCGLKASTKLWKHSSLNIHRNGFNTYVKFYLSFSENSDSRTTQVAVRSFTPVFNYHVEFPLVLSMDDESGKSSCLAERLDSGFLVCQIYSERKGNEKDFLIGGVEIPLVNVLSKSTGIKTWWPLHSPNKRGLNDGMNRITGGIEIESKFRHTTEREAVINHGLSKGWTPSSTIQFENESWFTVVDRDQEPCVLQVIIDKLWLPSDVLKPVLPLVTSLKKSCHKIYARYKLYDNAPVCSSWSNLGKIDKHIYSCKLSHVQIFNVAPTTSFAWYLREENLEIQFWLSCTSDKKPLPKSTDSLIGSCYVDLSRVSKSPYQTITFSDRYSLFKSSSDNVCDAQARIVIAFNETYVENVPYPVKYDESLGYPSEGSSVQDDEDRDLDSEDGSLLDKICIKSNKNKTLKRDADKDIPATTTKNSDDDNKMAIRFQIDEALHLPKYLKGHSYTEPNVYVSYTLHKCSTVYTNVCEQTTKPNFNFQRTESINPLLLQDVCIEFKVWRCVGKERQPERDILLGVSEVDTKTLFVGMKQIIGWYNILDYNRQIIGQLKVGIVPTTALSPSRSTKFFKNYELNTSVNLDVAFFSKQFQTSRDPFHCNATANTSSSMLFVQLKQNLDDLTNMTSKLKERLDPTVKQIPDTHNQHFEKQHKDESLVLPTAHTEPSDSPLDSNTPYNMDTRWENTVLPTTPFTILSNHSEQECQKDKEMINSENNGSISNSDPTEIHSHPTQTQASDDSNLEESYESGDEENASVCEEDVSGCDEDVSGCDSTYELMQHLKQFEQKYQHLKDIAETDDLDTYSGTIGIIETDHVMTNHAQPQAVNFDDDDVINVSSSDPSKEDIILSIEGEKNTSSSNHSSNVNIHTTVGVHPVDFTIEKCERNEINNVEYSRRDQACNNQTQEDNIAPKTVNKTRSTFGEIHSSTSLPNFFMRPQEMAESIKALRMAANFRKPPRKLKKFNEPNTDDDENTSGSLSKSDPHPAPSVDVKELIKSNIPVEASEMARIASIFASKT